MSDHREKTATDRSVLRVRESIARDEEEEETHCGRHVLIATVRSNFPECMVSKERNGEREKERQKQREAEGTKERGERRMPG